MNWKFWQKNKQQQRGYAELTGMRGGAFADWPLSSLTEDADLWLNAYALTSRVRDLFRGNPTYVAYREALLANVFGEGGIMLRMKVKEQADRIVYAAEEKAALVAHEQRINAVRQWAAKQDGRTAEQYRAFKLADIMEGQRDLVHVMRAKATIQVGQPDVYANQLIERRWTEFHRAKFCDMRASNDYKVQRQIRLISAVRDGEIFIRKIKHPTVNKFGFTMQLINAEWCDRFLNCTLGNGNEVRMGIEYASTPWGIGAPVAYYFIRRAPRDWQSSPAGMFAGQPSAMHVRIDASEIIHYRRVVDAEGTRPAPWVASTIPIARQLDQAMLAEVIAMREAACKTGVYYSDVVAEGGQFVTPEPNKIPMQRLSPGDKEGLPWGVKFQPVSFDHPNQNCEAFRKVALRTQCAGMPGADYNQIGKDLEMISFSAGRLGKLDCNEANKMIQRNDIDVAEVDVFETWLEMSLITGAIPLPLAKFDKFNSPVFQGRRWVGVDEVKENTAAALRMANHMSSPQRECAKNSDDFEEVIFEKAEANMIMDSLGIDPALTVQKPQTTQLSSGMEGDEEEPAPAKKPGTNGKHVARLAMQFEQ